MAARTRKRKDYAPTSEAPTTFKKPAIPSKKTEDHPANHVMCRICLHDTPLAGATVLEEVSKKDSFEFPIFYRLHHHFLDPTKSSMISSVSFVCPGCTSR